MPEPTVDIQSNLPPVKTNLPETSPTNNEAAGSTPKAKSGFLQKSPQELAAQIESVSSIFYSPRNPTQQGINEGYKTTRHQIESLLEEGVSDEVLAQELGKIYKAGKNDGSFKPTEGENAQDLIAAEKERLMGSGYSAEDAESQAIQDLSNEGFIGELRNWRRRYEEDIHRNFTDYKESHPLPPAEETEIISRLREGVIDISDPEQASRLAKNFPGGNFLYHGTEVRQAISILDSGGLVNAKTLLARERAKAVQEGRDPSLIKQNSGYEGISWNYGEIGAMPGDRYHLVGFLAAPRDVLTDATQLAIPSRPAPHELILIDRGIDAERYYSLKTQQELLEYVGMGAESNSALSNVIQLSMLRSGSNVESMLDTFSKSGLSDQEISERLKTLYSVRDNGTIEISPDLIQQIANEVPIASVWFQALIDTGRIKNVPGFEDITTVREAITRVSGENYKDLFPELRRDSRYIRGEIEAEDNKVGDISTPVSETYIVVPNTDLPKWLGVLARTGIQPKGIVVYDHMSVRLENFASMHRGDNQRLTDILQSAIPSTEGHIDYETQILGEKITPDKMVGYRRHVVAEKYLGKRKSLVKDPAGNILAS